ncbi:MAG: hypothetical protein ABR585_06810 [Gemmatimonadaceae bacterium]
MTANSFYSIELTIQAVYGTPPAPLSAMNQGFRHFSLSHLLRFAVVLGIAFFASASVAQAQRPVPAKPQGPVTRQSSRGQIVPPGFFPPAGMCRIWINDVPANQQPAPTDCASAVRNRPSNAKVLFGDESPKSKKGKSDKKSSNPTDDLVDLITRRISR